MTLFIHDSADRNLVIALLLVLDPDGNIGQGRDCGEHGIISVFAVLKAHIPDSSGVLIDLFGHSLFRFGCVLILAVLDCIIVILDKGSASERNCANLAMFSSLVILKCPFHSFSWVITGLSLNETAEKNPRRLYQ